MPAIYSKLHTLSLFSNHESPDQPYYYPPERDISRDVLVDVAPDREDVLLDRSIAELRQILKLRVHPAYGHWLFCSQKRHQVKLKDTTTRLSVFGRLSSETKTLESEDDDQQEQKRPLRVVRRVMSASSIYTFASTSLRNKKRDQIWGGSLSTQEKLISPRPLGATHILVVYAMNPADDGTSSGGTIRSTTRRRALASPTFPEVIELPINDLLFILNVPNLIPPREESSASVTILPRRLHKEMPRVLMHVPHLETFPELVIYLHTKNQAALFRGLIPEWIRDIMHPLPPIPIVYAKRNGSMDIPAPATVVEGLNVKKLLGRLVAGSSSTSSLNTLPSSSVSLLTVTEEHHVERTVASIAIEIAQAAYDFEEEEDTLVRTTTLLNALRDNLSHIGYFNRGLWLELDISRDIILEAISHQAKMAYENLE